MKRTPAQIETVYALAGSGGATLADIAAACRVGRTSARTLAWRLVREGSLRPHGEGNQTVFLLPGDDALAAYYRAAAERLSAVFGSRAMHHHEVRMASGMDNWLLSDLLDHMALTGELLTESAEGGGPVYYRVPVVAATLSVRELQDSAVRAMRVITREAGGATSAFALRAALKLDRAGFEAVVDTLVQEGLIAVRSVVGHSVIWEAGAQLMAWASGERAEQLAAEAAAEAVAAEAAVAEMETEVEVEAEVVHVPAAAPRPAWWALAGRVRQGGSARPPGARTTVRRGGSGAAQAPGPGGWRDASPGGGSARKNRRRPGTGVPTRGAVPIPRAGAPGSTAMPVATAPPARVPDKVTGLPAATPMPGAGPPTPHAGTPTPTPIATGRSRPGARAGTPEPQRTRRSPPPHGPGERRAGRSVRPPERASPGRAAPETAHPHTLHTGP